MSSPPRHTAVLAPILFYLALLPGCGTPPPTPHLAEALARSGDLEGACKTWEAALERADAPGDQLTAVRGWIHCLSQIGQLEQAQGRLSRTPAPALARYGQALALIARSPGALDEALVHLRRAAQLWPEQGEIPYRAGVLLMADEQPDAALPLLKRACKLDDSAACAAALGHALLDLDRLPEALAQARRIPDLHPQKTDLARGRALVARVTRRTSAIPEPARAAYTEALTALQRRNQPAEAVRILEGVLDDHPRMDAAHTLLGLAHLKLGNVAEAVVALRTAQRENPFNPQNPLALAVIHQARGQRTEAIPQLEQALQLDPFNLQAAQELAKLLLAQQRTPEALQVLKRALALDEASPLTARLAARAHLAARHPRRAEALYARLLQTDPDDFEAHLRLGQLLLKRLSSGTEDADAVMKRARHHALKAAQARPQDPEVERLVQAITARAD